MPPQRHARPGRARRGTVRDPAVRLLDLPTTRRARRRPVRRCRHRQTEALLDPSRCLTQPREISTRPEPPTRVLPHQHDGDVDVVIRVANRNPTRPPNVATRGHSRPSNRSRRDVGPLGVRQHAVRRGDAGRAMPDVSALAVTVGLRKLGGNGGRTHGSDQRPQLEPAVRLRGRLPAGVPTIPACDHPWSNMFLRTSRPHQVGDQATDPPAVHDLGDHCRPRSISATTASTAASRRQRRAPSSSRGARLCIRSTSPWSLRRSGSPGKPGAPPLPRRQCVRSTHPPRGSPLGTACDPTPLLVGEAHDDLPTPDAPVPAPTPRLSTAVRVLHRRASRHGPNCFVVVTGWSAAAARLLGTPSFRPRPAPGRQKHRFWHISLPPSDPCR